MSCGAQKREIKKKKNRPEGLHSRDEEKMRAEGRGVSWATVPNPRAATRGQSLLTAWESFALLMGEALSCTTHIHTHTDLPPSTAPRMSTQGLEVAPEKAKCYS